MKLSSKLPLQTMFFKHWHTDDSEVGIVIAKAQFLRRPDGRFRASSEPPELRLVEEFGEGRPGFQPLLHDQEIAPGKIGTDLLVSGVARSPEGKPAQDWAVGVEVPDRLSYSFRVRGPSEWRKGRTGWSQTEPELIHELPLDYGLAYGGTAPGEYEDEPELFEQNPAGKGFVTDQLLERGDPIPAAQIGELAEFASSDPKAEMMVMGLGPIAKVWHPRRAEAGTFDDAWRQTRHPRMPDDYSLRFWNSAPQALQLNPPLVGGEVIRLTGLSHAVEPIEIELPGVVLAAELSGEGGAARVDLTLDTVEIDATSGSVDEHSMILIWRGIITDSDRFQTGEILSERLERKS